MKQRMFFSQQAHLAKKNICQSTGILEKNAWEDGNLKSHAAKWEKKAGVLCE